MTHWHNHTLTYDMFINIYIYNNYNILIRSVGVMWMTCLQCVLTCGWFSRLICTSGHEVHPGPSQEETKRIGSGARQLGEVTKATGVFSILILLQGLLDPIFCWEMATSVGPTENRSLVRRGWLHIRGGASEGTRCMFSVVCTVCWVSFASVPQQFLQQGGFNGFNVLIHANISGSSWEILCWFTMLTCVCGCLGYLNSRFALVHF